MFPWSPIEEVVQELCAQRGMRFWAVSFNLDKVYLCVGPLSMAPGRTVPLAFKVHERGLDVGVLFADVHHGALVRDDQTGWVGPVSAWLDKLQVLEVMLS